MKPYKILHIVEDLKIGGMERVIASIAGGMDASRYEIHVFCLARGGQIADELRQQGVPMQILGMESYHRPDQVLRLSRIMRSSRYALVHTHGYFAGVFGRVAAVLARIPVVITHVHSTYIDYRKRHLLIEKGLSHFTDRIICVSNAVKTFVTEREGISPDKVIVIYNGVDTSCSVLSEQMVKRQHPGSEIMFIVVASLTANKGHHLLLRALQRILREGYQASLLIAGDGPLRAELEKQATGLSLQGQVRFLGEQRDVTPWLRASDILAAPTVRREGLGVSIIEAMACGLPVIGSNLGGIPELVESGINGLLVHPDDPDALADAMKWMIEHEQERKTMGQKGKEKYARQFRAEIMNQAIAHLYQDLLERAHA